MNHWKVNILLDKFALIVLNNIQGFSYYSNIMRLSAYTIATDGAANLISQHYKYFFPDIIIGDMDSLEKPAKDYYLNQNVQINHEVCQDTTDLEKALKYCEEQTFLKNLPICIFNAFGGRLDHTFQNYSLMLKYSELKLFNINKGTQSVVIKPGENIIHLQDYEQRKQIGIIPLSGPTKITTKGFKWEMEERECQMGGFVSSSNEALKNPVYIKNDKSVLLTTSINLQQKHLMLNKPSKQISNQFSIQANPFGYELNTTEIRNSKVLKSNNYLIV